MKTYKILSVVLLLTSAGMLRAQNPEAIDTAFISKIKNEGLKNSQVMQTLSLLTDVYGPRLTGSPGYQKAADYAKKTLESYGVQNVHFDYWGEDFGKGWILKKFSLQSLEPAYFPMIAYPKAWSPGVAGTIQAEAVYLDVKSAADLTAYAGKLKGKIVLFSAPVAVKPGFKADAARLSDSSLLKMSNAGIPEIQNGFGGPGGNRRQAFMDAQKLSFAKWEFCMKEGAVAVLEASTGNQLEDGTLAVAGATVPYSPEIPFNSPLRQRVYSATAPRILPQVVVADEHYNRLIRQIQNKFPVKLELTLDTQLTPPAQGFNIIGEIPGTDLADEVVMIGGHFDSWQSGTGATDNGCGSAVMMETMRIIKALGVKPRRTIRIGLWGGEEEGLIGSRSYVKRVLGERLDKTRPYDSIKTLPAAAKFSVYFNMDNGTGKYRGVYLQGNEVAGPIFRQWLKPFEKMGASTITLENTGGTDHLAFDAILLPGFQFIQDPIEYDTRTHHTSMDVYDKAVEADMKQNSVITAAFAWLAANRDGMIPRKTK